MDQTVRGVRRNAGADQRGFGGIHMSFVDKVKGMLGQHPDKAQQGVDKAGDMIDKRTGGKYSDKVDMGQDKARDYIEGTHPGDQARPADPNQPPQ
ncbi:hypothetical protein GCM10009678_27320 [Actinomadura kijaniata]